LNGGWIKNHFQDGLLTIHLQHTSASLLIQENADPDVRRDLEAFFQTAGPPTAIRFLYIRSKAMTTCRRTFARPDGRSTLNIPVRGRAARPRAYVQKADRRRGPAVLKNASKSRRTSGSAFS